MSYPYYMPENSFLVAPPMAILVEKNEEEIRYSKFELTAPVNLIKDKEKILKKKQKSRKQIRGLNVSYSTRQRGRLHGPVEELRHKIQRFKIKTIQVVGVVKKEDLLHN
ncbi:hypothetical protein JCGZ_23628 [Jatropha curcas]|uniref:Uncharacterized protein n=1 Tax=Jatropha curcas TaxID=180498 RepID=A0A067L661_JATCU|nr:hypothetical protein JCGZ_23628 [Jatropha curcas]